MAARNVSAHVSASTGRLFVGRESELGGLADALGMALTGRGSVTAVTGETGIGKTALVEEHLGRCRQVDVVVASGPCFEVGGAPPYSPWVRVLQRLARAGHPPRRPLLRRWLAGAQGEADLDRHQLFDLITSHLFESSQEVALVLVFEDFQWADSPSILLLRELASDLNGMRVHVIATYREGNPSREDLIFDVERQPGVRRLALSPLGDADVAQYLELRIGGGLSAARRARVLRWTAGNPLYMTEAARLAESGGDLDSLPPGIRELAQKRLSGLSPEVVDVLATAAVIGSEFELGLVARVANAPLEEVAKQLDDAAKAGIVTAVLERNTGYRFTQELLREAVYQDLLPSVRHDRHRQVAEAIESLFEPLLEDHLAELAYQWGRAGTYGAPERAAEWTMRAAEHAVQRLAHEEGVRLYEAALDLPGSADRAEILLKLARAQYLAGDIEDACSTCRHLAEIARGEGRPRMLAEAALVLEGIGDFAMAPELAQMCQEALQGLGKDDPVLRARLLGQLAVQLAYTPDFDRTAAVSAEAMEVAEETGDPGAVVPALRARQLALSGPEGVNERLSLASRMIEIGSATRHPSTALWGRLWRIDALLQLADMPKVDAEQVELERLVGRLQQPLARWHLVRLTAARAAFQGDFTTALSLADEARDLGRRQHQVALGLWTSFRGMVALETGDRAALHELVQSWRSASPLPAQTLGKARALLGLGREAEASGLFEAAAARFAVHPRDFQWLNAATMLGELACRFRSTNVARLVYPQLRPFAGQLAVPGAGPPLVILGCVSLSLGMLASLLGEAEAATYFREAIAVHDRVGARPYSARSRLEYAQHLAATGSSRDATELGRSALRMASDLGMQTLVASAGQFLEAATKRDQASPLTRRESEIAAEVAKGLTNKEIAAALFLSERTVETHVQNILGKLGFHHRTQVGAWAADRAAPD